MLTAVRILLVCSLAFAALDRPLAATPAETAEAAPWRLDSPLFPVPGQIADAVEFWRSIFAVYDNHQVVLHDQVHLDRVYAVLDFGQLEASTASAVEKERRRRESVRSTLRRYEAALLELAGGGTIDDAQVASRIERLLGPASEDPAAYRSAARNLRTQTGLRNVFAEAIGRSDRYLPRIEQTFEHYGLPHVLTRLPFVESMFQTGARSKAAAGGMWQITPGTGRILKLKLGLDIDERYDPLLAADAAARLLKKHYEVLQAWPLALTAYNHGEAGMRRAVRTLGTRDIGTIVERYKSRSFGFASRNFYAEFVAAVEVYENRERHFPGLVPGEPLTFDEFAPDLYVPVRQLAERTSTELDLLKELNPALTREVWAGRMLVPSGYPLRVPEGKLASFETAYAALPDNLKSSRQLGMRYRVRPGDTVGAIARRFDTTIRAVSAATRLDSRHLIRVGQVLLIPPSKSWRGSVTPAAAPGGVHVVRQGETLTQIAARYGTSVSALRSANRLPNQDRIFVGQRLTIPSTAG